MRVPAPNMKKIIAARDMDRPAARAFFRLRAVAAGGGLAGRLRLPGGNRADRRQRLAAAQPARGARGSSAAPERNRAGDSRAMIYLALRNLHIACVVLSGAGFLLRGLWMLGASPLLGRRWVRVVPHLVDSALLASAVALAVTSGQYPAGAALADGQGRRAARLYPVRNDGAQARSEPFRPLLFLRRCATHFRLHRLGRDDTKSARRLRPFRLVRSARRFQTAASDLV